MTRLTPPPPSGPDPGDTYRETWTNFILLAIVGVLWLAAVLLVIWL